jgi:fused signal recognition particle receptor
VFKALKDKLKGALNHFTKQASKEAVVVEEEEKTAPKEPKPKQQPEPKKEAPKPKAPPKPKEKTAPKPAETTAPAQPTKTAPKPGRGKEIASTQEVVQEEPPKKSLFGGLKEKLTTIQLSQDKFEELFWELELALLENNVAVAVIEKIKEELQDELTTGRTARGGLAERVQRRLEDTLKEILSQEPYDLLAQTKEHKPLVIAMVGVNGSGKTTTAAKLTHLFQEQQKKVVLAACDTFRAAAIQQLEEHAKKLGADLVRQDYGADPAAVAFDAIKRAEARGADVVIIDTAGRLHSNTNLMDELKKVIRVAKPHHVIFVGESITGNDCVEQAQQFSSALGVDAAILTKADVDEKGGAAVSVSYVAGIPILYLGGGQDYGDLEVFDAEKIIAQVIRGA